MRRLKTSIFAALSLPPTIPRGCVFVWIAGFFVVPLLFILNFECDLKLPPQVLDLSIALAALLCTSAIAFARISIGGRIGLLLATLVLWLIVFVAMVRIYAGWIF